MCVGFGLFFFFLSPRVPSVCDDTSSELQRVAALDPHGGNSRNSFQRSGAISRYNYDKPTAQHQSQPMTVSVSTGDVIRKYISDVPDLMKLNIKSYKGLDEGVGLN